MSGKGYRRGAGLLVLLATNYFFMLARHEGAHALVAWWAGAQIVDFHLWPPDGLNLSWLTILSPPNRPMASIRLQAALPYLVSFAMWASTLSLFTRSPTLFSGERLLWWAGAAFPILDLSLGVLGYWIADNDLTWIFGPTSSPFRVVLTLWVIAMIGTTIWVARIRGRNG